MQPPPPVELKRVRPRLHHVLREAARSAGNHPAAVALFESVLAGGAAGRAPPGPCGLVVRGCGTTRLRWRSSRACWQAAPRVARRPGRAPAAGNHPAAVALFESVLAGSALGRGPAVCSAPGRGPAGSCAGCARLGGAGRGPRARLDGPGAGRAVTYASARHLRGTSGTPGVMPTSHHLFRVPSPSPSSASGVNCV